MHACVHMHASVCVCVCVVGKMHAGTHQSPHYSCTTTTTIHCPILAEPALSISEAASICTIRLVAPVCANHQKGTSFGCIMRVVFRSTVYTGKQQYSERRALCGPRWILRLAQRLLHYYGFAISRGRSTSIGIQSFQEDITMFDNATVLLLLQSTYRVTFDAKQLLTNGQKPDIPHKSCSYQGVSPQNFLRSCDGAMEPVDRRPTMGDQHSDPATTNATQQPTLQIL